MQNCVAQNSVATGSGHPDYPGHLGHFLSGSKWVLPGHTNMPDLYHIAQGKTLANLANLEQFAKVLPTQIYT